MKIVIIPARYDSSRFPGKPLALINGKSMIWHVYHRSMKARLIDAVWVATDDERIEKDVRGWGGKVMKTKRDHPSGTDRIAEVASKVEAEIIINVQGDEPLMDPKVIDAVVDALIDNGDIGIVTPITPIKSAKELFDPSVVKVVRDKKGLALYFSRAPVPFIRGHEFFTGFPVTNKAVKQDERPITNLPLFRHIGLYGYRREALLRFCSIPPSSLEKLEKLEQLRALENGIPILTVVVDYEGIGVDSPQDLQKVRSVIRGNIFSGNQ